MLEKLAYNLGRNDEEPNIALAVELCDTNDSQGISEIVQGLKTGKEQQKNDCIKVLYEIGEKKPDLIADYVPVFIELLKSKNNRLIWGGMTALSKIAPLRPGEIFENIAAVIEAYENGSVITRDNSITVFAELAKADKEYEKVLFRKLMKHLETCRSKEVGQHAERIAVCINKQNAQEFISVLLKRRESLTEAQKKRVDKLIKNISVDNFTSN